MKRKKRNGKTPNKLSVGIQGKKVHPTFRFCYLAYKHCMGRIVSNLLYFYSMLHYKDPWYQPVLQYISLHYKLKVVIRGFIHWAPFGNRVQIFQIIIKFRRGQCDQPGRKVSATDASNYLHCSVLLHPLLNVSLIYHFTFWLESLLTTSVLAIISPSLLLTEVTLYLMSIFKFQVPNWFLTEPFTKLIMSQIEQLARLTKIKRPWTRKVHQTEEQSSLSPWEFLYNLFSRYFCLESLLKYSIISTERPDFQRYHMQSHSQQSVQL